MSDAIKPDSLQDPGRRREEEAAKVLAPMTYGSAATREMFDRDCFLWVPPCEYRKARRLLEIGRKRVHRDNVQFRYRHGMAPLLKECLLTEHLWGAMYTLATALEEGDWKKAGVVLAMLQDAEVRVRMLDLRNEAWSQELEESVQAEAGRKLKALSSAYDRRRNSL